MTNWPKLDILLFGSVDITFLEPILQTLNEGFTLTASALSINALGEYGVAEHPLIRPLKDVATIQNDPDGLKAYFSQTKYDVFNLHFVDPSKHGLVTALPNDARLLVSFWGGDLMATSGVENYSKQLEICQRADLITLQSWEMREILLAKFGRELEPKVRLTRFPLSETLLGKIDAHRQSVRSSEFLFRYGVSDADLVICVGHSGHPRHRHLDVLQEFEVQISPEIRNRWIFILPFTYNRNQEYTEKVKDFIESTTLSVVLIEDQMSEAQVAELRLRSDILVQVPTRDAFSSSMVETLYAGNVVIVGDWLPYSTLRRYKVDHFTIAEIKEIPEITLATSKKRSERRSELFAIKKKVWRMSVGDPKRRWLEIYKELLSIK